MSSFNSFNLYQDFIVLNNVTFYQHNVYTIKREHIISVEKTKVYSTPMLLFGILLIIFGFGINVEIIIYGASITFYQAISMLITTIVIKVPGYSYLSRYCGDNDYATIVQWFNPANEGNVQVIQN